MKKRRERISSKLNPQEKWMTQKALESVERALYLRGVPSDPKPAVLPHTPVTPRRAGFSTEIVPDRWISRRARYLKECGRAG